MADKPPLPLCSAKGQHWQIDMVNDALVTDNLEEAVNEKLESTIQLEEGQKQLSAASHASKLKASQSSVSKKRYGKVVSALLAQREIGADAAKDFLSPPDFDAFAEKLPEYLKLKDMQPAVERIAKAIMNDEVIGISGDYDCDGNCSIALLRRALIACGVSEDDIVVHVPNRVNEGYGVNTDAVDAFSKAHVDLMITLDNGTLAHDAIKRANTKGIESIVVDHHPNGPDHPVPDGALVVNPNRYDETHADKSLQSLAAVGVTYLLVGGLKEELSKYPENRGRNIDLRNMLGLTALATVGDVVDIKSNINRFFVSEGIKVINEGQDKILTHLCRAANVDNDIDEETLAFRLAPIINAPGRISQSFAWEFLSAEQADHPEFLLKQVMSNEMNEERKRLEAEVTKKARVQAESILTENPDTAVLVVAGDDWPEGVIGIVAGRIKEEFGRPVLACSKVKVEDDSGQSHYHYKTSGRSIEGVDLGTAFRQLAQGDDPAFLKAGGHPMAAGATFDIDKLEAVRQGLSNLLSADVNKARDNHSLKAAGVLPLKHVSSDLVKQMNAVGPYGQGNPRPLVVIPDMVVRDIKLSKNRQHFFVRLEEHHKGIGRQKTPAPTMRAMAFHAGPKVEEALKQAQTRPAQLLGTLALDDRTGDPVLRIEDIYVSENKSRLPYAGTKEILGEDAMNSGVFTSLMSKQTGIG